MEIRTYLPEMEESLRRFVRQSPDANPAHLIEWREVLQSANHLPTSYLVAKDNGTIRGVLPLALVRAPLGRGRLVSLPYLSHGGICARDAEAEQGLLAAARRAAEACKAPVELRGGHGFAGLPARDDKARLVLDVSGGVGQVWSHLRSEIRNRVRKAERAGLHVLVGGAELLPAFYAVFCSRMTGLGTPPHPRRFFEEIVRLMPDTRVIVACNGKGPAAAGVLCFFRDSVELPWVASRSEFLNSCPNHLLYWEAIRFACEQRMRRFDFGRSTIGSGPYVFKRRWGAEPERIVWQYVYPAGCHKENGRHAGALKVASRVWKHLPVPAARAIGPLFRRYLAE